MQVPSSLWPQLAAHAPTTARALDANAALLARFAVGNEPVSAAVNSATDRVYVAVRGATGLDDGAVTVVSGASNAVLATVPVGRSPSRVLVNESTNRIYALHGGEATYKVIDGTTNAVTATIPATFSGAFDGALDAGRARLYLTHNNHLTVFNTDTNTQVGQVNFLAQDLPGAAFGVAVNRATNTIYVIRARTNAAGQGYVSVINGATLAITANIDVGLWPELLDVNESTGRVYVQTETGPVKVIDGSTNAVIATIALADGAAGLSVDPTRDRLYVAIEGGNRLAVVDTAADANAVLVQVPTGGQFPQDAAVNTATDRVYLPNFGTDDLSVVGAPALLPDLVASNVTVTPSVAPGATVTYSWRVTNQGTGTATASEFSWGDQAWISTSATSIAGAYPAGGIVAPNSLAPGASYDRSFSATVGAIPPGSYWFIIQTDNGDDIGESNEGNNLSAGVPITVTAPAPRLAYVYKTDTAARDAWVAFLGSRGYAVDTFTETAAGTADLSPYRAILIGNDTGDGDPRIDPWGTPAIVANIAGAGKPIIGLGDGGSKFFDAKAGGTSKVGYLSSWIITSGADAVIVVDGADPAWTVPNATGLATGATATLYSAPSTTIAVFAPATVTGVTRIGRQTDDADHYPIIREGCDVHWGFSGSAASLTTAGQRLFENLLDPCAVRLVTVSAEVREDLDRDATFDAGEPFLTAPRLEVFRINADGSRTSVGAAVNSPNLSVSGIASGVFDIVETDPAGYVSTSSNTVRVTVNAGSSLTRFMDARDGVSGTARHRETPDGTTIVDVVLAGATVTLLNGDGTPVLRPDGTRVRLIAAADGSYAFPALAPGAAYIVGYDGSAGVAPNTRNYITGVRFTTDASGGAYVPAPQAVFNRGNHTWITAFQLPNNTPVPDQVWRRGQATWYRFPIGPQQTVTIELTGCAFNCDLVVYRDLQQIHERLLADAQTQAGVRLSLSGDIMADDLDADDLDADDLDADDLDADDLDADDLDADDLDADDLDADDLDADDLDADDLDADDLDADDLDADDLDADDLDADDLDADDLDADDLDADDLDADDLDADDLDADGDGLTGYGTTYVAAQRKGLRAASLTPGLAPETVTINTRDLTGDLYVRVAGGSSLSGVFSLTARRTADVSCVAAPLVSRAPSTTFGASAAGKRSLILTDTAAFGLNAADRAAFLATLGTFAAHATVQGQVVDLANDANLQQLRADWAAARTCVAQANLVTDAIRQVVQRFSAASGSFEYLINAGGDAVIPFRRVTDWAEISRESRYNPPLAASTASEASLIADTFLNDDFYVASAVDGPNRSLYLPDAAVGRLVESVADISAYVAMYLAANGTASPTSALSSGYDFNLDLAAYVSSQLTARGLAVDSTLQSNTWSSADWRAKVLESAVTNAFGILSLQGHFSANRLVPADNGQRVLSTELAAITDGRFLRALVYSLGCHSGYSIVDADGTILTQVEAFPEVFVRQGATVVAGTGYQYGETILMKNTEALMALLTDELGYSTSPAGTAYGAAGVPIGKALMYAKRAYMGGLATPRGIDLKVVGVSTVYGSPTMSFKLPSTQARPASGTLSPAALAGFTGLSALDITTNDSLTAVSDGSGTYYTANGATSVAPYRPIAPLVTVDANVAGSVLQGAVFLGGAYTESAFTPRLSIPATELSGEAPRYANDVFMPVLPVRANLFDGDSLQITPFQYRSNADGTAGTARVYGSGVQVRAFWSSRVGTSAAADAPVIRDIFIRDEDGQLVIVATLRGVTDPGIAEVWLTYTDATAAARSFASIQMVPAGAAIPDAPGAAGFTRLYEAVLPGDPAAYRFLVQAVSGNGRVSAATNNGELYRFVPAPVTPPAPPVDTRVASALSLAAPANATYRSTITATATLTGAGQPLAGKTVTFAFGGSTRSAVTGTNGVATATLDVNVTPRLAPYALTASFAGDATAHGSAANANVTVGRAPTVLTAIAASPQYSDGAPVARLTAHGLTLNEQPVVITRGTAKIATFTDFAGDVRFDTIDFGAGAGSSALTVEYLGNDRYAGATLNVAVPVQAENATLALTQPGPQPTGAITFTAQVAQAADGSLGDLRRATVAFTFTPASGSPVSASSAADASGAASVTVTLPAGLYQVAAQVTGDFTSDVVAIAVPVYDASAFVSGGGWLTTGTDSLGVPLGVRANFGFMAEYGIDGTTATGDLNLHVKSRTGKDNDTDAQARANGSLKFKATSFEWLVIAGNGAAFTGTGTVNGLAGYRFRADVVDDGSTDLFVIHIWDADSTYAAPDHIVRGTLGGGNIRIHR